jgi:acyl carrier protein phosphodiesterase
LNYLAHLFLAGTDPELILGNFIADHVKGSGILRYPETVRKGIAMHRAIDTYTDQHPVVRQSILRLRENFRKYAGVITDMYYDHFLSLYWTDYSVESLDDFTQSRYAILNSFQPLLPPRSARLLYFMEKQNWLEAYSNFDGMQQAFNGMARRTSFESGMEMAVESLKKDYLLFQDEFRAYFPDLQEFVFLQFGISSRFEPESSGTD